VLYENLQPPSTTMVCPVMKAASSEECQRPGQVFRRFRALDRLLPADHVEPAEFSGLALDGGLGSREPRRNGVDGDPEVSDLRRQRAGKSDDAALACRIVRVEADAGMKGGRGHADDAAPALFFHCRQEGLHQEKDGIQIDGEHLAPLLEGDLVDCRGRIDAGAVHEDVATADLPFHRLPELATSASEV
jgi:hypothetical protein